MSAAAIAHALKGNKTSGGWLVCCPAHEDRNPSLSIKDGESGKLLVKCWAGCAAQDVLAALRQRGLLAGQYSDSHTYQPQVDSKTDKGDGAARTKVAIRLWQASKSITAGCPVEIYLRGRGITLALPSILRYYPGLKHPEGLNWPGMLALVQHGVDERAVGIHRTFLARDGNAKAPVSPDKVKMMLGPCRGGAVRLAPAGEILMVGEGIETCLSAMQAAGLPTWAALSTSGLCALDLPPAVREVIVLADGDDSGEQAAQAAALRWKKEKRKVLIARPPRGLDFNDMLLGRMAGGAA